MTKIKTLTICFVVILFIQFFSDSLGVNLILSGTPLRKIYPFIFSLIIYTHILYLLVQRMQNIESLKKDFLLCHFSWREDLNLGFRRIISIIEKPFLLLLVFTIIMNLFTGSLHFNSSSYNTIDIRPYEFDGILMLYSVIIGFNVLIELVYWIVKGFKNKEF
mgnify:CR=1 FL=1